MHIYGSYCENSYCSSRNVAFKAAKIAESALAGQSEILTREVARVDIPTDWEALDELGRM